MLELARTYDQLDVANATLKQRQLIYDLTRQRVAAGLDTRVELKEAEAALPATREDIARLNETAALTRNQVSALIGQGPDRGLAMRRPQLYGGVAAAALPSRLPADLLGRRPDVVASRWRVQAAAKDAQARGETEQRLYALNAWRETPFYSERERAALARTEAVTLLGHFPLEVPAVAALVRRFLQSSTVS